MQNNIFLYIAIMVGVTTLIRVLPLTLIRKEIKNVTLRSFLYYIPYVTTAVMTFPTILLRPETPSPHGLHLQLPSLPPGWEKVFFLFLLPPALSCLCWNCSCAEIDLNDRKLREHYRISDKII